MSQKAGSSTRAVRLLLKAIRGLPERERQVVFAYLVERACQPSQATPVAGLAPSFVTPELLKEVAGVASRMLRSGRGVAAIADLYAIPEEAVHAAVHEVASDPEAPQPLASILGLLAEGRSEAAAARELGISKDDAARALDGLASSPLEWRLGQALSAQARMRAQAAAAFRLHPTVRTGPREPGAPTATAEGLVGRIGRMLVAGCDVGHLAAVYDVPEDSVRSALREAAAHADASEPLASILRLLADGRTRAEIAEDLRMSEDDVTTALEALLPSPVEGRLSHALQASVAVRSVRAQSSPSLPGVTVTGSLGSEPQMVPVRFPEPQYRRLKEWCGRHGFSMAVVVRGLVERFLDDQERRAA